MSIEQSEAGGSLSFDGLAALVRELVPQVPTRLRCHPTVAAALRTSAWARDELEWSPYAANVGGPLAPRIDVVVDDDLAPGAWDLLDSDGEVIQSGALGQPECRYCAGKDALAPCTCVSDCGTTQSGMGRCFMRAD